MLIFHWRICGAVEKRETREWRKASHFFVCHLCVRMRKKNKRKKMSHFFHSRKKKPEISDTQELLEPSNGKVAVHWIQTVIQFQHTVEWRIRTPNKRVPISIFQLDATCQKMQTNRILSTWIVYILLFNMRETARTTDFIHLSSDNRNCNAIELLISFNFAKQVDCIFDFSQRIPAFSRTARAVEIVQTTWLALAQNSTTFVGATLVQLHRNSSIHLQKYV